jgi:hypothetical protein
LKNAEIDNWAYHGPPTNEHYLDIETIKEYILPQKVKNYEGFNCIPRNVLMGGESAVKTYY